MTARNFITQPGSQFLPEGTGAVERTVESKLRDVVSVKDFGAVGDGVADDTAAFQAAFNYCRSIQPHIKAGVELVLPPGTTYNLPSTLNPYGIKISGHGAKIIRSGTSALFKIVDAQPGGNYTTIEGITFVPKTNTATDTGTTIVVGAEATDPDNGLGNGAFNVYIKNCKFPSSNGTCIHVKRGETVDIRGNSFSSGVNGHIVLADGEFADALGSLFTNGLKFIGNRVNSHDRYTGGTWAVIKADGYGIYVEDNELVGNSGGACLIGTQTINTFGFTYKNNFSEQNGPFHVSLGASDGSCTVYGFEITGSRLEGLGTPQMTLAVYLASARNGEIHDVMINDAPTEYALAPIGAEPTNCSNISIRRVHWNYLSAKEALSSNVWGIPGLVVEDIITNAVGFSRPFGFTHYEVGSASTTPTSSFTLPRIGTYTVNIVAYGNGTDYNNNAIGSWKVFYNNQAINDILVTQEIVPDAVVGIVSSLVLSNPTAAGEVTATLTQSTTTTCTFYWQIIPEFQYII